MSENTEKRKIAGKRRILLSAMKLLRFPVLPKNPKRGKFYRILLPDCVTASGDVTHGSIRIGTENKVIVMFHGGGVSWNEHMAARPVSIYEEPEEQNFYACDSDLTGDLVTGHGIAGKKKENPFRNWSVISILYNTGDFHVGQNDFPYTDLDGGKAVLHHHGYINYRSIMKEALKWIGNEPEQLLVTGFSAGGFGTALLTDDVMSFFPKCRDVICYPDSCFMLYRGWREVAEKVWKAPREICERIHTGNITLDSLAALKEKHGEKVKVLFSCSVRDLELSKYWNYVDCGMLFTDRNTGWRFQQDLKEMCRQMQEMIPNVGIYIFDTLVDGRGMEQMKEQGLTVHCIGLAAAAEQLRVEGRTVVEWVWDAVNGKTECIGLKLLEQGQPHQV